jgi:hypothetical protein
MNRITPNMPVQAYRSFEIRSPLATHYRPATCGEVDCTPHLNGWTTRVDESTELGQQQAHYIRHDTSRRHTEERQPDGLTAFAFEAGQRCFAADKHQAPVGRPEIYLSRGGDWRGTTTGPLTHSGPEGWLDEFQTNQDHLKTRIDRG